MHPGPGTLEASLQAWSVPVLQLPAPRLLPGPGAGRAELMVGEWPIVAWAPDPAPAALGASETKCRPLPLTLSSAPRSVLWTARLQSNVLPAGRGGKGTRRPESTRFTGPVMMVTWANLV